MGGCLGTRFHNQVCQQACQVSDSLNQNLVSGQILSFFYGIRLISPADE